MVQHLALSLGLLALVSGFAKAADDQTLYVQANTEWMGVNRVKTINVKINDDVKDGCWKTPLNDPACRAGADEKETCDAQMKTQIQQSRTARGPVSNATM